MSRMGEDSILRGERVVGESLMFSFLDMECSLIWRWVQFWFWRGTVLFWIILYADSLISGILRLGEYQLDGSRGDSLPSTINLLNFFKDFILVITTYQPSINILNTSSHFQFLDFLLGCSVLPALEQHPERSDDEGGEGDEEDDDGDDDRVLQHSPQALVHLPEHNFVGIPLEHFVHAPEGYRQHCHQVHELTHSLDRVEFGGGFGELVEKVVLVEQRDSCPRENGWNGETFEDVVDHQEGLERAVFGFQQHVEVICHIRTSLGMSLCLPEPSLNIFPVPLASLDIDLVEWYIYWDIYHLPSGLPKSFLSGVEILPDRIRTGVPEPYPLNQVVAHCVVGDGKYQVKARSHVGQLGQAVGMIVYPGEYRHIHVVSGENLGRDEDGFVPILGALSQILFDFVNVHGGHPRVSVDNGDEDLIWIYHVLVKVLVQVFSTPRHV